MIPKPSSCLGCPLHSGPFGKTWGFSHPSGTGLNGVMMVAEALGENEEAAGMALVGKAGHYFFNNLKRVGIERDDFTLFNVIACRPPNNKLAGMPWEKSSIEWCAPNLDRAIDQARSIALTNKKHFTIVTLGRIAFKRVMGLTDKDPLLKKDYKCYPFWSDRYQAWVVAVDHPSYLMRGNHHMVPVLQFGVKRALEIAEHGLEIIKPTYLLDPIPAQFGQWVADFKSAYRDGVFLSYDIETPMKQGEDEEDVSKEDDDDYTILRCSFSYRPNEAVSVPWRPEFMPMLMDLFAHPCPKIGWNSENYDGPRVRAQMPLNGDQIDGMLAWHVLNSSLPKGLGFVTPFYNQSTFVWKYLSDAEPAFYNAKDADMALQCWLGISNDLKANDLWKVFGRHVIEVNRVFAHMSREGIMRDEKLRADAETRLSGMLSHTKINMEAVVPTGARALKVYKKTPKDTTGMIAVPGLQDLKVCPNCKEHWVKAAHFKAVGKKRLKVGDSQNPCVGFKGEKKTVAGMNWARPLEFKISNVGMQRYQKAVNHRPIFDPKEKKITFDEKAILRLKKRYPLDKLYPLILEHRLLQKLLSTYIGVTEYNIIEVPDNYILQPGELKIE